jgi:hypothetical protein
MKFALIARIMLCAMKLLSMKNVPTLKRLRVKLGLSESFVEMSFLISIF